MKDVSFDPKLGLTYLGRNGTGKQVGVSIMVRKKTNGTVYVTFAPINSLGGLGPAAVEMPAAQIDEFFTAVKDELAEFEESQKPQPPLQIMEA